MLEYIVAFVIATRNGNGVVNITAEKWNVKRNNRLLSAIETGVMHDEWDWR